MLISVFKDNYTTDDNFGNNEYYPPGTENLEIEKLGPLGPLGPLGSEKENRFNADLNTVPNYGQSIQSNESSQSNNNLHDTIYRTKTGREFYEQENFVSIYDSNFGGYLGTTLGTTLSMNP